MNCPHPAIQHSQSPLCHHEASAEAAVAAAAAAAAAASSLWEPQLPASVISAATGGGTGGNSGGGGGGAAHCMYPGGPAMLGPLAIGPGLLAQSYPLHLLQPQQPQLQAAASAAHWQHLPLGAAGGGGAAAAAAAAAASGLFGDMLGEQHQQAAAAAAAAAASCQQLCLLPGFDLVKWYSEKPPFVLDGRIACLYKMREIDRRLHSMVLSADAEFNTILAEYAVLRRVFGPEYPVHENVFIKLNRSKEGELAKFIHIYFRDRNDAQFYLDSAQRVGALAPCWCNPKTYSKHNVYITSLPYFLLAKDALCQYIRTFVLPGCGARDPIRRARVDPDKRSAQVEFHRSEDAESLIEHFHRHMDANARPAFESKEQRNDDCRKQD